MASASFSLSNQFLGSNFIPDFPPTPPSNINFCRALRISSSHVTAERTCGSAAAPQFAPRTTASFYEVLGIPMCASVEEIKTAYRRLARVLHPDVASTSGREAETLAADEFMRVHTAYATLSDPEKRADYDRVITLQQRQLRSRLSMLSESEFPRHTRRRTWETDQCW